jgi:uncharacterized delta-60 repeat protein
MLGDERTTFRIGLRYKDMKGKLMNEFRAPHHSSIVEKQMWHETRKMSPLATVRAVLFASALLLVPSNPATAQAGKLDPTFGSAGVFTDSAAETNNSGTFGTAVALQSDGKIVAGGQIGFNTGVLRLNANGTLDTTFGHSGMVTAILGGSDGECQVTGLAIQSDGKIIVGISNLEQGFNPMFIVARLNVNGSLDATFGSGGIVETQIGQFGTADSVLTLQPDGKIVLAGTGAMARYNSNGQFDSTFGGGGIVAIPLVGPSAIALQPDGKIVLAAGGSVVAYALTPGVGLAQAGGIIARYNSNGSPDTSFGVSGQAGSVVVPGAISVQSDGVCSSTCKILVGGTVVSSLDVNNGNSIGFGVGRFNSDGTADATFAQGGAVSTSFAPVEPNATAFALALQANGNIVAAGTGAVTFSSQFVTPADFALVRYTGNGALDSTFGTGGKVTTAFGSNQASIYALAVQSDGKIVAVGPSLESTQNSGGKTGGLVVARYLGQ